MSASIIARLGLDSAGFQSGLKGALGQLKGFAGQFTAVLGAASLAGLSKSAIDLGSKISDLGTQLRIGTDELQVLQHAAREAGVPATDLEVALKKLTTASQEAANGNAQLHANFSRLNINLDEFLNLPTERKMEALGKAFVNAGESQEAFTAVSKILGESAGPRLTEVLQRMGYEGFDSMAEAAKNAGAIMDKDTIKALDMLADKLEVGKNRLLVAFAPAIVFAVTQLMRFATFVKQAGAFLGAVSLAVGDFGQVAKAVFRPVISIIENAVTAVKGLWQAMTGDVEAAVQTIANVKLPNEIFEELKAVPGEAEKAWGRFTQQAAQHMQTAGDEVLALDDEFAKFEKSLKAVESQSKKTMQAIEATPGKPGNAERLAKARQIIEQGLADMERKRLPANQQLADVKQKQADIEERIAAGAEDAEKLAREFVSLQRERLSLEEQIADAQTKAHQERMQQLEEQLDKEKELRKTAIDDQLAAMKQGLEGKSFDRLLKEAPEALRLKAQGGGLKRQKGESSRDALQRELFAFREAQAEAAKKQVDAEAQKRLDAENLKGTEVAPTAGPAAPSVAGSTPEGAAGSTQDLAQAEQQKQEELNARLDEFKEIAQAIQAATEASQNATDEIVQTLKRLDSALK